MRISIQRRSEILTFVTIVVSILASYLFVGYQNANYYKELTQSRIDFFLNYSGKKIAEALINGDTYSLGLMISDFCNMEKILGCKVLDGEKKEILVYPNSVTEYKRTSNIKLVPIIYSGKSLGWIKFSIEKPAIFKLTYSHFVPLLAFSFILSIVSIFLTNFLFVKPFRLVKRIYEGVNSDRLENTITTLEQLNSPVEDINELIKVIIGKLKIASNAEKKALNLTKYEAIAKTTQMLAHDVRKPFSQLHFILSTLDSLKDNPSELYNSKIYVKKSIQQVERMINEIMAFSKDSDFELKPASLIGIFDFALKQTFQGYPELNIELSYDFCSEYKPLLEEEQIARCATNILINSVEAISIMGKKTNGTINISTLDIIEDIQMVEITIGNNGPCFPKGVEEKLFDSFYTNGKSKGTGLGLSSVQRIVSLHNGSIFGRNKDDNSGVDFVIRIPASTEKEDYDFTILPNSINDIICPITNESQLREFIQNIANDEEIYRIVLLEDEALYRAGIKNLISSNSVLSKKIVLYDASTVDDALNLVANQQVKYAIVDIDLNDTLDGYDFLSIVKEKYPNLRCLVHSNRTIDEYRQKAFLLGAKRYAPKPLSISDLVEFLNLDIDSSPDSNKNSIFESELVKQESLVKSYNIALVEDDQIISTCLANRFQKASFNPKVFSCPSEFWEYTDKNPKFITDLDLLITDFSFENESTKCEDFLNLFKQKSSVPTYICSNYPFNQTELDNLKVTGIISKDSMTMEIIQKIRIELENLMKTDQSISQSNGIASTI